jgi:KTSC domain
MENKMSEKPVKKPVLVDKLHVVKNSSNISRVAVVDKDLIVEFTNGALYKYEAAAVKFDSLTKAESAGKYVNAEVKTGFKVEKLNADLELKKREE